MRRNRSLLRSLGSIIAVLLLWELLGRFVLTDRIFFVPFTSIIEAFGRLWAKGTLQVDIATSVTEFVLGFALASVVGFIVGLAMAVNGTIRDYLDPWVSVLYSTPLLALSPLLILWLGLGVESKVAVIALVVVFPVLLNTYTGVTTTEPQLIETARSFGASAPQIYRKVMLPSALPVIVVGLRLGLARGLVGVVVAEFFGARHGVGFLALASSQVFDTAAVFLAVALLAGTGVLLVELLKIVERRLAPWRRPMTND